MNEIIETLDRYVNDKIPTGGFLRAVLANDLMGAFGAADIHNRARMFEIVQHVYSEIPRWCHGSYEIVDKWLEGEK